MFLIRTAFWLSLVILLLPVDSDNENVGQEQEPPADISAVEAFGAARATMADLSTFCERNPDACETGSAALRVFGQKAQTGVRMVYEYVTEPGDGTHIALDEEEPDEPSDHARTSRSDTLNASDLDVPWRGPGAES